MEQVRNNMAIIDSIFVRFSEKLDRQLYNFDVLLEEKENLDFLDGALYEFTAGQVLLLVPDGSDKSNNPQLTRESMEEEYEFDRLTITKYLLTKIHYEIEAKKTEALDGLIYLLKKGVRSLNREFTNILYLIVLFDGSKTYNPLCRPLAQFCANIIYNEELERGVKV